MALAALVGFGPTYYFKAFGQGPMATLSGGPMTLLVHAHGALFSAWVLLVSVPLRLAISTTEAWKVFAQWTVGLV
jgi:hypothetical protein